VRLDADLARSKRPPHRGARVALFLGALLLVAGVATFFTLEERIDRARARASAYTQQLEDGRRTASSRADPAEPERQARIALARYRESFPLNDLLKALEGLQGVHVLSMEIDTGTGETRLDLQASEYRQQANALASLEKALPQWDVVLIRQSRDSNKLISSISLRDHARVTTLTP